MKINVIKYIAVFILFTSVGFSQSVEKLEVKVLKVKAEIIKYKTKVDSLSGLLEKNNSLIRENLNKEDMLTIILSKSAELSEEINYYKKEIKGFEKDYNLFREDLFAAIKGELSLLSDSKSKERYLELTQKQIIYAPLASQLQYNPELILSINTADTSDVFSREVIKESLKGAIEEVNNHINKLDVVYNEFSEISELNRMANEFTEEIEFDSDISTLGSVNSERSLSRDDAAKSTGAEIIYNEILTENLNVYSAIVTQLNIKELGRLNAGRGDYPELKKNMNLTSYIKYLKDVKNVLEQYKVILIQKRQNLDE